MATSHKQKAVSFAPADPNEGSVESEDWEPIVGGVRVRSVLQKYANYLLIIQPGDDSQDRQEIYVTTVPHPLMDHPDRTRLVD